MSKSRNSGQEASIRNPKKDSKFRKSLDRKDMTVIAASNGPISLDRSSQPITLILARKLAGENKTLASHLKSLRSEQRIYLVLRGLCTEKQPGVLYHLFLDLPTNMTPGRNDERYVGSLHFFDSSSCLDRSQVSESFTDSYDITDVANKLFAQNSLSDVTTITFVPAGEVVSGSKPQIGRIEIVVQSS